MLVLAPTGKDAALTRSVLERAGLACDVLLGPRRGLRGAGGRRGRRAARRGGGRVRSQTGAWTNWLARQPPWSDLPVLVLARPAPTPPPSRRRWTCSATSRCWSGRLRVAALVSAVRTALRARQRQYQIREHLTSIERQRKRPARGGPPQGRVPAILAHELRNPLAPIRNSLHILRLTSQHDPAVRARRRDDGAAGQPPGAAGGRPARGLAHHPRQDRAAQGAVELAAVVRSAVETSRPLIEAASHQLTVAIPAEPLTLDGDPSAWRRCSPTC